MIAELLILIVLPALLALAGGWDLASFTIPNFIQIALLVAFGIFAFVIHLTPAMIGAHLLAGLIGLIAGFTLFALGYIGGGDAKLFACAALWLGFHDLPAYTLIAAILGGALTLLIIGARRLPLPALLVQQPWISRLHDPASGIPYGVALAAGFFVILPQTQIFHLAAGL